MIVPLLSVLAIFVFLCISEVLWRTRIARGETGRKLVHIVIGTFVAFWPFIMSFEAIQIISIAFLIGVLISKKFHIFHAVHGVKRENKSWGEVLFAVSIGLLAVLSPSPYIFSAAVLHMSLADGLAGLVGWHFGRSTRYVILGQYKSLAGSGTFAVLSSIIIVWFLVIGPANFNRHTWPVFVGLPIIATVMENVSLKGTDNILVPFLVAAVLSSV